ncbi:peptidoglycan DD-metalloendopeptidase family protein [uncultured Paraglaciecola sp.]|jgi:murein hydrolase activator|uniref:murein hydrolase activator EnvC family protein n=1 Tax=uncultured Paraglaciecola sp. TaxID=1765024 RepID=UPI0025D51269|nr:peptidoglycan DD-metalloendopeptidase family protein [uncultured Paraglaciecola sp.]
MFCGVFFVSDLTAQEQSDLESIQQQIKNKQAQINQQLEVAKTLQDNLKDVELQIAKSSKELNQTEMSLDSNQKQLGILRQQQKGYLASLEQQKSVLAKQIRSAYMTGNYDFAKMLLNQQDAANFERTITYYQYLNKARKSQIDSFNLLVIDLQKVNAKLIDNQSELEQLKDKQLVQQRALQINQIQREKTLIAIQNAIESEEAKIAQLQINEKNLLEALTRAQQQVDKQEDVTLTGLSDFKGRLLMPAKGNLRKMFGRFRQGQIKWKGVVINGTAGDSVIAIHQAKVLYSDWLRGFGLVTVLDHGNGFMSLYGHNQALLKQAGEAVQAGEAIALLGQSGGQSRPNLYFEIRHKGTPINPVSWLKL